MGDHKPLNIYTACEDGKQDYVEQFIKKKRNINECDVNHWTPLHWAASCRQLDICSLLLENNADPTIITNSGSTPLHFIARIGGKGQYKLKVVVDALIKGKADINARTNRNVTPLHEAAARGSTFCISYLIEQSADPNLMDSYGEIPLHQAVKSGNLEAVKILMGKSENCFMEGKFGTCETIARHIYDPVRLQKFLDLLAKAPKPPVNPISNNLNVLLPNNDSANIPNLDEENQRTRNSLENHKSDDVVQVKTRTKKAKKQMRLSTSMPIVNPDMSNHNKWSEPLRSKTSLFDSPSKNDVLQRSYGSLSSHRMLGKSSDGSETQEAERSQTSGDGKIMTHEYTLDTVAFCQNPADKFEVQCKLGAGAYGSVYKAICKETNEVLAIKAVPLLTEHDPDCKKLSAELEILNAAYQDNITGYKGAYYNNVEIWILMDYCDGGSLGDLQRKVELQMDEITLRGVVLQILYGLEYLHAKNIVHRDIKGENILIHTDGRVKLADFGVASMSKEQRRKSIAGSPYWMAPEIVNGEDYDQSADIWSLGITIIQFIDINPPYYDLLPVRAFALLSSDDYPPPHFQHPENYSTELNDFVKKCLTRDPAVRPSAHELLNHPWLKKKKVNYQVIEEWIDLAMSEKREKERLKEGRVASDDSSSFLSEDEFSDTSIGSDEETLSTDKSDEITVDRRRIMSESADSGVRRRSKEKSMGQTRVKRAPSVSSNKSDRKTSSAGNSAVALKSSDSVKKISVSSSCITRPPIMPSNNTNILASSNSNNAPVLEKRNSGRFSPFNFAGTTQRSKSHSPDEAFRGVVIKENPPTVIETLEDLVSEFVHPTRGIKLADHKGALKNYKDTFSGQEAVDWMINNKLCSSREEAVVTGQQLVKRGFICHVLSSVAFSDTPSMIYRFTDELNRHLGKVEERGVFMNFAKKGLSRMDTDLGAVADFASKRIGGGLSLLGSGRYFLGSDKDKDKEKDKDKDKDCTKKEGKKKKRK